MTKTMMKLTANSFDSQQRAECREFIRFCMDRLGINDYPYVDVRVTVRKYVQFGWLGICDEKDLKEDGIIRIAINRNQDLPNLYKTIAHELVHAKQYLTGDLYVVNNKEWWRGQDTSIMDYDDQPHEIEAYAKEEKLYRQWCYHQKKAAKRK